jgi:hypothetical protein
VVGGHSEGVLAACATQQIYEITRREMCMRAEAFGYAMESVGLSVNRTFLVDVDVALFLG